RLLARSVLFLQSLLEHLRRGLQINDQVWRGQLLAKIVIVAIVRLELLVIEIQAGEKLVFLENEICNNRVLRIGAKIDRTELFKAADEKRELGLKRRPGLAIVESLQKLVVVGLHNSLCVQALGQNAGQRALPDPDGTFHGNVAGEFEQ